VNLKPSSWKRLRSHIVSDVALASAQYSASVEDLATTLCFFKLQDMGVEPKKLIYADLEV
jgi:hypothetical protein